jgi:hypothetical protein
MGNRQDAKFAKGRQGPAVRGSAAAYWNRMDFGTKVEGMDRMERQGTAFSRIPSILAHFLMMVSDHFSRGGRPGKEIRFPDLANLASWR